MSLRGDTRGQSNVIGAILIFGFVVALIGANQVVLVPQNNEEIEFNHYQSVQTEMSDARSALVLASGTNNPQSTTVKLGKGYPVRALARNPSPVAGSLQTGTAEVIDGGPIGLTNICGWNAGNTPKTKTITYTPNYNYLSGANPIKIDNAVAYQDTSGEPVLQSGQILVRGDELTFLPIKGSVGEQATGSMAVDFIPSETGTATVTQSSDFEIGIPPELSASTWENELLAGESRVIDVRKNSGTVFIELEDGTYDVRCTTIGINQAPDVTPANTIPTPTNPGSNTLNPVGSGEIELKGATLPGSNTNGIDVELENKRTNNVDLVSARIIAYTASNQGGGGGTGGGSPVFNPPDFAEIRGTTLEISGAEKDLSNPKTISSSGTTVVTFDFFEDNALNTEYTTKEGDWMIVSLTYETQGSNPTTIEETYIIAPQ